ncbi:MAG: hypothetical protein WCF65_03730, partial [Parachlamydiaceae bacterium]
MKKKINFLLIVFLIVVSSSYLEAYPEFSHLASSRVSIEDPFEFHVPSPLDIIADQSPPTHTPDLSRFPNLEDRAQDFVLESKQLEIDGFPGAFNPTVVRWRGALLMAFRVRNERLSNDKIGMIWLDENLDQKGSAYILDVPPYKSDIPSKQQDPRLIVIGENLYMSYSNVIRGQISPEVRRAFLTRIHFDGVHFYTDTPEGLYAFEGEKEQRWEKNWTPFEYNGDILLTYSITPHRILKPIIGTQSCEDFSLSDQKINWKWGSLRGGTQLYMIENEYFGFFH